MADGPGARDSERVAVMDFRDACRRGSAGSGFDGLEIDGIHIEAGDAAAGVGEGDRRLRNPVGEVANQRPGVDRVSALECRRGEVGLRRASDIGQVSTGRRYQHHEVRGAGRGSALGHEDPIHAGMVCQSRGALPAGVGCGAKHGTVPGHGTRN